ncbi:MAG: alpha/beta hydrolase [Sphingobacteriales bacterium]|nr:MAG: alpha/beta hydrolase [Sphingobacteriales bacterium]
MTDHYFKHPLVNLHYYRFGTGAKTILCFHGLGMHGKQFTVLEKELGTEYTFFGFDLFFHKETSLINNDLKEIRKGITQPDLAALFADFCAYENIERFSIMAYSMGTFYAAALMRYIPERIEKAFLIAPSFLKTPKFLDFLANNIAANFFFEKLLLSKNGLKILLRACLNLRVVDQNNYEILYREIATAELRFNFYANVTYLKHLNVNYEELAESINKAGISCYFIFGESDKSIPPRTAGKLLPKLKMAKKIIVAEGHDLVTARLTKKILFCEHDNQS